MTLNIRVIAPDRTVWDVDAKEVILPSSTGQLGILTGHIPLLTALDIGVMRVRVEQQWIPMVLLGGFAEVEDNQVTILVNGAEKVDDIDVNSTKENLDLAAQQLAEASTRKEKIDATQNLRKARARLQAVLNSSD